LKRQFFLILLKLLLYTGTYLILREIFSLYQYLPGILVLLFVIIFDNRIHIYLDDFIWRKLYPSNFIIKKILTDFNDKINSITDYKQLIESFFDLFNNIFSNYNWAFYVLEKNTYLLERSKIDKKEKGFPIELKLKKTNISRIFIDLEDKELDPLLKNKADINTMIELETDLMVPLSGKNQVIALLFTHKKSLQLFNDPAIKQLVERVLNKAGNFLENTALYLDLIHRNLEIRKLFEVSEKLLSSFNTNEILDFILKSLEVVIPYDAAAIFLLDDDEKNLIPKASVGYGAKTNELGLKLGQGACGWVAKNKKMSLLDDVSVAVDYYPLRENTNSQIALPLLIQDDVLGVICLEKNELAYFTSNFIDLLNIFANQAAIALYNAKQYEISVVKRSLEHELINASKVQQVLLPNRAPKYSRLDISFINKPSKHVGGDLFDFIPINDLNMGVMIGDVAGKGAGAAIMMSLLLAGFRAFKKTQFTVCETVARLNVLLEESISSSLYATFFYGMISFNENKITYTNAGHNSPLLVRKDGTAIKLYGGGIVLGYLTTETYIQEEVPFSPGDLVVLYTDGITEAMNSDSEEFGEDRLLDVIQKNSSESSYRIREKIIEAVKRFSRHKDPEDDATLIIIKYIEKSS